LAGAADVSEQTVFNYFPRKEDLVYERMDTFELELLAAVRERARANHPCARSSVSSSTAPTVPRPGRADAGWRN
jgi:AcrR family transcriptional regulator